jgi:calcineurin-like phosphoesterase family protein
MSKVFFTSDQHFGHENIIKHCERPFNGVDHMDDELTLRWNEVVSPRDIVYCLGDFTLGGVEKARKYFSRLYGRIVVLQNAHHHDRHWIPKEIGESPYVSGSGDRVMIAPSILRYSVGDRDFILCHFPFFSWERKHHGSIHLYGHTHSRYEGVGLSMDVGVDAVYGFAPISLSDVIATMDEKIKNGEDRYHP